MVIVHLGTSRLLVCPMCPPVTAPQPLRASLRDALSYHGAQYGTAEVDAAPYAVLRSWMQAAVLAIQRRCGLWLGRV